MEEKIRKKEKDGKRYECESEGEISDGKWEERNTKRVI